MTEQQAEELAWAEITRWALVDHYTFRFNNSKTNCGLCYFSKTGRPGRIELSRRYIASNPEENVLDTIRHEVAHALAGPTAHHGPVWQDWCRKVGCSPVCCSEHKMMPAGIWQATCPGCTKLYSRHRRPRTLTGFFCRTCGQEKGMLIFGKVEMKDLYLARTLTMKGNHKIWVLFTADRTLFGKPGESKHTLLARWNYGKNPEDNITVRYKGLHRPSELAMTIGELRMEEGDV